MIVIAAKLGTNPVLQAFLDSEYVIYNANQQRLVYLLECDLERLPEEEQQEEVAVDEQSINAFETGAAAEEEQQTYEEEEEGEGDDGEEEVVEEEEEEEYVEDDDEAPRPYVGYNPEFPFSTPPPEPSYSSPPPKPSAALVSTFNGTPVALVAAHIRARIVDFAAEVQLFHVRITLSLLLLGEGVIRRVLMRL